MVKTTTTAFNKRRRRRTHSRSPARIAIAVLLVALFLIDVAWQQASPSRPSPQLRNATRPPPQLLSRHSNVKITTDVRGNLGSAAVLNQDPPRTDWIKDRWQAASDMHGTAIQGAHWVLLEFPSSVTLDHIVLDWEAALSKDYVIEYSNHHHDEKWTTLFDTNTDMYKSHEYGQSPGVKTKTPLHIVHNITIPHQVSVTRLRIWIRTSAHVWGVSLWQVDVYGWLAATN